MRSVSTAEASRDFGSLLDAAENGETIEVTDHGRPVGRLHAGHLSVGERVSQVLTEFALEPAAADELARAVTGLRAIDDVDDIAVAEWPVD